jgi:hypothetical protein
VKDRGARRADKARKRKEAERQRRIAQAKRAAASATPLIDRLMADVVGELAPDKARQLEDVKARARELTRRMRARSLPVLEEIVAETEHRVDGAVAAVFSKAGKPACKRGCAYCCHIHVTVHAPEVFHALDFARKNLSPDALAALAKRAAENAERVAGATSRTYPQTPCAFLVESACSVYAARPMVCRSEHSYDVDACRRVFETGKSETVKRNLDVAGTSAMEQIPLHEALGLVFEHDARLELQQALHIGLTEPNAAERWLAGEDVFESAVADESD